MLKSINGGERGGWLLMEVGEICRNWYNQNGFGRGVIHRFTTSSSIVI